MFLKFQFRKGLQLGSPAFSTPLTPHILNPDIRRTGVVSSTLRPLYSSYESATVHIKKSNMITIFYEVCTEKNVEYNEH
jgi:hypothetical protein